MPRPNRTKGWFRVEPKHHGDRVRRDPYIPARASVGEDKTIERIPVCAEIGQCLRAITTLHLREQGAVYRAVARPRPALDYEAPMKLVPDWETTEEVWIVRPCFFEFVGLIEIKSGILRKPEIEWRWLPRGKWREAP